MKLVIRRYNNHIILKLRNNSRFRMAINLNLSVVRVKCVFMKLFTRNLKKKSKEIPARF